MTGVTLINPKYAHNVGNALRACACWGVQWLWYTGERVQIAPGRRLPREERFKGYKHVEAARDDQLLERPWAGTIPVAVEIRPGCETLVTFEHPLDALYLFGPEDGTLPKSVLAYCHRFIMIPTHFCLNLAAAVNVVLYDRRLKRSLKGLEPLYPLEEILKEHRGSSWTGREW